MAAEPGLGAAAYPFGNTGAANDYYMSMKEAASLMKQIEDQAATDAEIYVSEMARVTRMAFNAMGGMFREETIRTMVHIAVSGATRAAGYTGGTKGIMEYKVIANLKAVGGDKTWLRQWHLKFTAALGQVKHDYEWMMNKMTKGVI